MKIETLSVFPQMFEGVMSTSIIGRARRAGILEFVAHDLRKWTHDNHNTTDDEPYGGGSGQLMKVEPVFEALDELLQVRSGEHPGEHAGQLATDPATDPATEPATDPATDPATESATKLEPQAPAPHPYVIFFSPVGKRFDQNLAGELAKKQHLIMVCGRYEGFDERVYTRADLCLSLGDYVITGGELAAMVVSDAVCRLLPGVLGDEHSSVEESFAADTGGLLEYPQYTRPAEYKGLHVPAVLLSGHHQKIAQWRREQSIIRTAQLRPDLLAQAELSVNERELAAKFADVGYPSDESFAAQTEAKQL